MAITLNGTTGITTPDVNTTAQSTDITTTGDISAVDLTASGGVYLGGTAAANYLDDYEEGTWTVEFYDASSGGNASSTTVTGAYTKIGRQVTAQFSAVNISTSGMTAGNAIYFTVPFTSKSGDPINYTGSVRLYANTDATTVSLSAYLANGNSRGLVQESRNGGGITNILCGDLVSGASDLAVNITYFTP